ncbi:MAG: S8 family serine peptidase [Bdellovibrionales bacterium]|nr:S8 family serine peptidase [Bdellovibrionales bacterium]
MKNQLSSIVLSSLLFAACTGSKAPQNQFENHGFMDGIYSTRPQTSHPVIAIIKLKNPALLETATRDNGVLKIDQDLLTAIQDEQTSTIAELQKISPDIRILLRYRLVLNALTIYAPQEVLEKIQALPNVITAERSANFARPRPLDTDKKAGLVGTHTSVNFIGADAAYAEGFHGEGMRVGIIDTGVDYTHKMFNGEGTEEAYKANDPAQANAAFPNKKVVGGLDLVGTAFDSASPNFDKHIPVPDVNPLDEAGHGTHVAGTVAGLGDGVNTYSGVAPEASLYAIKVFGANGSTSDEVVIAALEYAADPSGDLSFKEQLDVVNLSLGSGYGSAHNMYNHAIKNLSRGGTVVVASAGNSGDKPYITGSPAVSDDAISVASSVDNQDQNILFPTVQFAAGGETITTEMMEAAVSKPLADVADAKGEIVFAGLGDADFEQPLKDQITGKVALIDRGKVNFSEKIRRAQEAGAIAVIVANNADGDPFTMGGDGHYDIPAVMISKDAGAKIKAKLALGAVVADLKTTAKLDKPWLIDTISDFSSRGPRSEDGLIKPEISAPGSNIISAGVGGGAKGVLMSGTSMAGPHITGVMTLLKQKFKTLNSQELKSIAMSHAKVITDGKKNIYPVARQGSGRVQIADSLDAKIVTVPAALSFGITDSEKQKTLSQKITVKNLSTDTVNLKAEWSGSSALQFSVPSISLAAGETKTVTITVKVSAAQMTAANQELDGFLKLSTDKETLAHLPALVVARQISNISAQSLKVHATSAADAAGSDADVVLQNASANKGSAYLFNSLGIDGRKKDAKPDLAHNRNCDLQSAGYRIVEKDGARILQVAVKLYERMTTWNSCELNVQIDSNGDNLPDQEIAGVPKESLPGLTGDAFVSLLLDGNKARDLRHQYEADLAANKKDAKEDYTSALVDMRGMQVFDGSTLAIVEADVSALAIADSGELNIKISTTHQSDNAVEYDDYLGKQETEWKKISLGAQAAGYVNLPEVVDLGAQETQTVSIQKGYGAEDLIIYAPQNRSVVDVLLEDSQSQVIAPAFGD